MNTTLERQFSSLLTALKVVSLAAMIPALYYFITTLAFVPKTQQFASEMLPDGTSLSQSARWTFVISDLLASYMLFVALFALIGIGFCVWITIRSKAGHFLYVNLGICLLLLTVGAVMRSACASVFASVLFEMNAY